MRVPPIAVALSLVASLLLGGGCGSSGGGSADAAAPDGVGVDQPSPFDGGGGSGGHDAASDFVVDPVDAPVNETGDTNGADGVADSADAPDAGDSDGADGADSAEASPPVDRKKVAPTVGCGSDPQLPIGATVLKTIATAGTKDAMCADRKCGPWAYIRDYTVTLPIGYDKTHAYPLVFEGPNCMGSGANVLTLESNVDNSVIRVGLTPPPNDIQHSTNPGQSCFDDKEGDDSVDFVLYEMLWDQLAGQLCFDRNRVFAAGEGSGAWLANELGCHYAGDATHPIRGVMAVRGGLPTQPMYAPSCSGRTMAGMWIINADPLDDPIATDRIAVNAALRRNQCSGSYFDSAMVEDFPIGAGQAPGLCKKILGCPSEDPMVVCPLHPLQLNTPAPIANPAFATFLKLFAAVP